MREYSDTFDMSTIPDDVLRSEWARRNARKRASYTGGVVWAKHNPAVAYCRCAQCIAKRAAKLSVFLLAVAVLPAFAETRDFPQPCADVYRRAAQTLSAAHFEATVSDAAGGVITAKYTGDPMAYAVFPRKLRPLFEKYTTGKTIYHGLTLTRANATLAPVESGCRVTLDVNLAGIDSEPVLATRNAPAHWVPALKPMESNGTAEREFLDRMAK